MRVLPVFTIIIIMIFIEGVIQWKRMENKISTDNALSRMTKLTKSFLIEDRKTQIALKEIHREGK